MRNPLLIINGGSRDSADREERGARGAPELLEVSATMGFHTESVGAPPYFVAPPSRTYCGFPIDGVGVMSVLGASRFRKTRVSKK